MGFWSKLKKAVKKVADVVESVAEDIGDSLGNACEAVGDAINDGLNWVGEKLGIKPFFSWLGGILKGLFALLGTTLKGVFGIVGGLIGGLIKVLLGIFSFDGSLILEGLGDIFSPIFGFVIMVGAKAISLVQSIFYLQGFERPLTADERRKLKRVFRDSLNYYVIRVIEGHAGIFGLSDRKLTLGNTIYFKGNPVTIPTLVHEATHVWQYQQTGDRYTSDALWAQWFIEDEYSWEKEINDRDKDDWIEFNAEAQSEFVEDVWEFGMLRDTAGTPTSNGNGCFFDADGINSFGSFAIGRTDYTTIATNAVDTIRNY